MTKRLLVVLGCLTFPVLPFPFPVLSSQQRALTVDEYLALPVVGDPQLSPDGKWVAYTVTHSSLKENRGTTRIWLADVTAGTTRQLTAGPGSDRQPRWSPDGRTLAFVSTRESGPQLWLLPVGGTGGEARRVSSLADGVSDPVWLPDGTGVLVASDIKWPADQEIDRRNGEYATEARIWTQLMWRHWDDWRAGKRQHLFLVSLADASARDLTPVDHDVPTIATSGDGDVAVAPDGHEIAVALHGDSSVADNTNVDIYLITRDGGGGGGGGGRRRLTAAKGADNTPRYSPDGQWLAYLSMERPGFEADRERLMLVGRTGARTEGRTVEATAGWTLSIGSYTWCPDSKCIYAVVEERGRESIYRIDLPSFRRSVVIGGSGVNSGVGVAPDGKTLAYLHQSATHPAELWVAGRQLSHHSDAAVAGLALSPLEEFGFRGALGDSVYGWILKPPGFESSKKYPLVYLLHGGPQTASRALYEKWSPLNFVRNWKTPILIVHSQLDYRVDLSEGYQAFTAAKRLGVPAKFLYFPDEGHWVLKPRNRRLWWGTVLDWLDQYLRPQSLTGAR